MDTIKHPYWISSKCKLSFWISALCIALICLFPFADALAAVYQHEIQVDFTFDTTAVTGKTVTGYRLYKENNLVCEAGAVDPQTFTCNDSGEIGTYSFTLTARYNDGSESPHSTPFHFTFTDGTEPPAQETPPTENEPPAETQPDVALSAVVIISPSTSGQAPFSVSFDGSQSIGTISTYSWSFGDNETSSGPTVTHTYQTAGTYTTSLTVTDINGQNRQSEIIISVSPPTSSPPAPTEPEEVVVTTYQHDIQVDFSFDTSAITGKVVTGYRLYKENSILCEVGAVDPQTFTCSDSGNIGTYAYTLTALYDDGSESAHSTPFSYTFTDGTPTPDPDAPLTALISTSPGLMGQAPFSVFFDGSQSTGQINAYSWSFGDSGTATGPTATHTFQTAGTYTISLTVSDQGGATQQSSVTITVTASTEPPPPVQTPPVPVISSSASVGEAPFSVNFDGSSSSSTQPPITSYTWTFGDGATAHGATVSHTFAAAGTYHTSLTVTDSTGLSAQTSTPVVVTTATVIENEPPVASFVATPISGKAPLNVTFDASGSTDSDGTISSYIWSLGDGSTANGPSIQHTFTEAGEFTVSLEVADEKGDKSIVTQVISVQPTDLIKLELQEVQADNTWKKVTFNQPFTYPVIVAGPMGYVDSASASLRIRNVTSTDCEVRVEEWYDIKSPHSSETFNLLIIEKGVYNLENGLKLEAGVFKGSTTFQKLAFQQAYNVSPVVVTQVSTTNEIATVTGRLQKGTTTSIEYKMQEREKNKQYHQAETVGYVAWEPGSGEYNGMKYEVLHTPKRITSYWSDIAFQNQFNMKPYFLAGMQTYVESDTATVRMLDISTNTARVKIEEEQSKDVETSHAAEVVGYIAIAPLQEESVSP